MKHTIRILFFIILFSSTLSETGRGNDFARGIISATASVQPAIGLMPVIIHPINSQENKLQFQAPANSTLILHIKSGTSKHYFSLHQNQTPAGKQASDVITVNLSDYIDSYQECILTVISSEN